jgi:hypothetical protein
MLRALSSSSLSAFSQMELVHAFSITVPSPAKDQRCLASHQVIVADSTIITISITRVDGENHVGWNLACQVTLLGMQKEQMR